MKNSFIEKKNCTNCKKNKKVYAIFINKKELFLCDKCLTELYEDMGRFILPKSPTSVLKKDNVIKRERF